ncbi:hypothetical protein ES703_67298 [subsurface metagenome]
MPTEARCGKTGVVPSHPLIIEEEDRHVPSKGWAEMIRRVYEVDPLICPSCGGQMRIIAFIEDHNAIDRIIRHLKLTFAAERPPPPQAQPQLAMAAEERAEYLLKSKHYDLEGKVYSVSNLFQHFR